MKVSTLIRAALVAAAGAYACAAPALAKAEEKMYGDVATTAQHPEWLMNAVIYEVNLRQGTPERTLKGMEKELPRLRELGVDVLWLMPVHPISELNRKGTLGSYYSVADYKAINPEFGTMDDFKSFVNTAHKYGMKVIIDEVCNHSGCDNAWVKQNPKFYATNKEGKMYGPFDWTDTYKFNYDNKSMRMAMLDALRFWVREADIDGYRFDVAMEVPTDFWEESRRELQRYKDVFFLAEASKPELTLNAFDADYNWPMKDVMNAIAFTQGVNKYAKENHKKYPKTDALAIDSLLTLQRQQYPKGALNMLMVTNHDLNSWEGTELERYGEGLKAFAVLTYTLPGIPMMYTGQEVGFNHAFKFFEQDVTPDYTPNEYTAFYKKLNDLRHRNAALWSDRQSAEMQRLLTSDKNIYAFTRERNGHQVVVIANLSNKKSELNFRTTPPSLDGMTDYFSDKPAEAYPSHLGPWEYKVYVNK